MNAGAAWLQLLGSGAVVWVLNKAWNVWTNRRKLPTNAVTVLQQASSAQVELTRQDNTRLRAENDALERQNDELREQRRVLMDALRDQVAYTKRQTDELRRLGSHIEDPPPLPPELLTP